MTRTKILKNMRASAEVLVYVQMSCCCSKYVCLNLGREKSGAEKRVRIKCLGCGAEKRVQEKDL
jgi:hypothetical protein